MELATCSKTKKPWKVRREWLLQRLEAGREKMGAIWWPTHLVANTPILKTTIILLDLRHGAIYYIFICTKFRLVHIRCPSSLPSVIKWDI